jgi:hypothetical protein
MDVFTATATVTDVLSMSGAASRQVRFVLHYSTYTQVKYGTTDGSGKAAVTYYAPVTSGTYQLDANFDGDGTYGVSGGTSTVTVTRRGSGISAADVDGIIDEICTPSATLKDAVTGLAVSGGTVDFSFYYSTYTLTKTGVTDASGKAVTTYVAPSSSGSYKLEVGFAGNGTYDVSAGSSTVTVERRPVGVVVSSVTVKAMDVFVGTATLVDVLKPGDRYPEGKTVRFVMNYSTYTLEQTGVTDGAGIATATYTAPVSSGTYNLEAYFDGDGTYLPDDSIGTVSVSRRSVVLTVMESTATAKEVYIATATIRDSVLGDNLAGRKIDFTLNYATYTLTVTAYSNEVGIATAAYRAPVTSGTYRMDAVFGGDGTYTTQSSSGSLRVVRRPTSAAMEDIGAYAMDVFTATATLRDVLSTEPMQSTAVRFVFAGSTYTAVADAFGVAHATYTTPNAAGVYAVNFYFAGDGTYVNTSTGSVLTTIKRDSMLTVYDSTTVVDGVVIASSTLRDVRTLRGVAGKQVQFSFAGENIPAVTDQNGNALVTYAAPASSGAYRLDAAFGGDESFNPSTSSGTITVVRREISLALADGAGIINEVITATATFRDSVDNALVADRPVRFVFVGSSFTATADDFGVAVATYAMTVSSGPHRIDVYFDGDAKYLPGASSATFVAARRNTTMDIIDVMARINEVVVATATLTDNLSGAPIAGKTVWIGFNGSDTEVVTDGDGTASASFSTVGISSGVYALTARFDGDVVYRDSTHAGTADIMRRTSAISGRDVTVMALDVFTATATVTDGVTGQKLADKTVAFCLEADTHTVLSDAVGVATTTFAAPAAAGSYGVTINYTGDTVYMGTGTVALVTVTKRPVQLDTWDVTGPCADLFVASATLTDVTSKTAVAGRAVRFVFEGSTLTALTDELGYAATAFYMPDAAGTYPLNVSFDEDDTYMTCSTAAVVTGLQREISLGAIDTTGTINEVFTATATLKDVATGTAIAGRTIRFVFAGSSATAATDSFGMAYATYTALVSSGAHRYDVYFDGDAKYGDGASSATVTILRRDTGLGLNDAGTIAVEVFTATAAVHDVLSSLPLADKSVRFIFDGSTFTALTDSFGMAYATFTAAASGIYRMDAIFDGDPVAAPAASSATVTVVRRPTDLTAADAGVPAQEVFVASATLRDTYSAAVIPNIQVRFVFEGQTHLVESSGVGVATTTFTAPDSSGTYAIAVYFDGDPVHSTSTATALLTVTRRDTGITVEPATAVALEVFTSTAALRDVLSNLPVAGKDLRFDFEGSSRTAATGGDGKASVQFTAPASSGTYLIDATFGGDATYASTVNAGVVTVLRRPAVIASTKTATVALEVFTASATLTDVYSAAPLSGKDVRFVFEGATVTAATDGAGFASAQFSAPAVTGTYTFSAAFDGDGTYLPAAVTAEVTVAQRLTRVRVNDTTGRGGEPLLLTGTLADSALATGVAGRTVVIEFNGESHIALTDSVGVATTTFTAPLEPKVYTYTMRFDGDYTYAASSETAKVKVGLLTTLVANDVETTALSDFSARAKLTDAYSIGLENRPLRFVFQASSGAALTDTSGTAMNTFKAPVSTGTYYYNVYFDGDGVYAASDTTATVTVALRMTTVIASNATVLALSSFTATAEVRDVVSGGGVPGLPLRFTFAGTTVTAVTDGAGQARTEFFAGSSSGTWQFYAAYAGNSTYAPSDSTGTVTVQLRPTLLVTPSVADAIIQSSFTARAELKDSTTNTGISGRSILFAFRGTSQTVTTDGAGVALALFATPASSGTYGFTADFAGDGVYTAAAGAADVTVSNRPTIVVTGNISVKAGSAFAAQGKLLDVATQKGVSGKQLTFVFLGPSPVTVTGVTGADGVATADFTAPVSTGVYEYTAAFAAGDPVYLASDSTGTVTIATQSTYLIAASGLAAIIRDDCRVSATLTDSEGKRLAGCPVVFTFNGGSTAALTDEIGVATAAFSTAMLASTGTYTYGAAFPGDTTYTASSDTNNVVNVAMRATALAAKTLYTVPGRIFTAEAALTDNVNGSPLAGTGVAARAVSFAYCDGASTTTIAGLTDAYGVTTATFTAPLSTGTYTYVAVFDCDGIYEAKTSSGVVYVMLDNGAGAISTTIKAYDLTALISTVFTATATLSAANTPVAGKALEFTYTNGISSVTKIGYTDAAGMATAIFTAPASTGTYSYRVFFTGDATFGEAENIGITGIVKLPVTIVAEDVAVAPEAAFLARATLSDAASGVLLSTRTVIFDFYAGSVTVHATAPTDAYGVAATTFTAPPAIGNYFYTARFDGDSLYAEAIASATVFIESSGSQTFLVLDDVFTGAAEVFTATATITAQGRPVPDKRIAFSFQGAVVLSTTAANGVATAAFNAPVSSGVFTLTAAFAGDAAYKSISAEARVTVVFREFLRDPSHITIAFTDKDTITIEWPEVTKYRELVKGYAVERTARLNDAWERFVFIYSTAGVHSCSFAAVKGQRYFYRVKTVAWDKQESKGVVIVEVPEGETKDREETNHIYLSDDNNAWVKVPDALVNEFYAGGASTAPLRLSIVPEQHAGLLLSYHMQVTDDRDQIIDNFEFTGNRRGIRITISYAGIAALGPAKVSSAAALRQMALYTHNGVEWIKLGGVNDILNKECYTYSQKLGRYGIILTSLASEFTLTKVAPRIFTPEESLDVIKYARFYFENPENNEVTIRIFDLSGALIRRNLEREGDNVMLWDGRDNTGAIVKGGVYIYQIEAGRKVMSGTIVVAK